MKIKLKKYRDYSANPETLQDFTIDVSLIEEYFPTYTGCFMRVKGDISLVHVTASFERLNEVLEVKEV